MTVVDASVVVRLLFARPDDDDLRAIFSEPGDELVAPDHIDAEVLSAVIGLLKGNHLERERATTMIRRFAALPIRRYRRFPSQPASSNFATTSRRTTAPMLRWRRCWKSRS